MIEVHVSRGELTLIKEIELFQTRAEGEAFVQAQPEAFSVSTSAGWRATDFRLVQLVGDAGDQDDYATLEGAPPLVHIGIESTPHVIRKQLG